MTKVWSEMKWSGRCLGGRRPWQRRESDWEVVTAPPRSGGQTGADRPNVLLLRCAELLNRQSEHRPVSIGAPFDLLWMNQTLMWERAHTHTYTHKKPHGPVKQWPLQLKVLSTAQHSPSQKEVPCTTRIFQSKRLNITSQLLLLMEPVFRHTISLFYYSGEYLIFSSS